MKLHSLLKRSKHFAHRSRRVRMTSSGMGKRRYGGYRRHVSPYLSSSKSSSSFFQRHKGKAISMVKLLGTLGSAYAAYKYGRSGVNPAEVIGRRHRMPLPLRDI